MHIKYSAHILNLVVKEGLKDYNKSIIKICDLIKFVKALWSRLQKRHVEWEIFIFKKLMYIDVPTR